MRYVASAATANAASAAFIQGRCSKPTASRAAAHTASHQPTVGVAVTTQ